MKPIITITLIEREGECACHRGHKIGDSFDFDTELIHLEGNYIQKLEVSDSENRAD